MTAPTPEQMRALAEDKPPRLTDGQWNAQVKLALFAAADQLEAVRDWAERELEGEQPNEYQRRYQMAASHARRFVIAADTAPQEERDE